MLKIFLFVIFVILCISLIIAFILLGIINLSQRYAFFFKVYLFIFEHEDYKTYKQLKCMLNNHERIPIYSQFVKTEDIKGFYFIPSYNTTTIWKNQSVIFVNFHHFIIDELIRLGNYQEEIEEVRKADIENHKKLENHIKQLKKEIEEAKVKLAKLNEQDND